MQTTVTHSRSFTTDKWTGRRAVVQVVAVAEPGDVYVHLYFDSPIGTPFEVINVFDYRVGKSTLPTTATGKKVSVAFMRNLLRDWFNTHDEEERDYMMREWEMPAANYTRSKHPRAWLKAYVENN
jgi:hypothetical protein